MSYIVQYVHWYIPQAFNHAVTCGVIWPVVTHCRVIRKLYSQETQEFHHWGINKYKVNFCININENCCLSFVCRLFQIFLYSCTEALLELLSEQIHTFFCCCFWFVLFFVTDTIHSFSLLDFILKVPAKYIFVFVFCLYLYVGVDLWNVSIRKMPPLTTTQV